MKRETLQKRIEKHLYTQKGTLAKKYETVFYLITHPTATIHPIKSTYFGLQDKSYNIEHGLKLIGIDFETGNDAPRGGRDGYYIKLSKKGREQVSEFCKVTIPDSVTEIGNRAFAGCKELQSVIIPDSVTEIGDCAFGDCTNLQSVTIGKGVTKIGRYALLRCRALQSVTIPDSVTEIGKGALEGCESLQSVTIPDSVTEIGEEAFEFCTSLQSVTIPDSVKEIGKRAFAACTSLKSVTIPQGCQYDKAFAHTTEVIIR